MIVLPRTVMPTAIRHDMPTDTMEDPACQFETAQASDGV
jgi:hypothetical protein